MSEYTIWYIGGFSGFVERRKMKLYLEKKMIENKEITNDGLAVYVALRKLMNKEEKEYYISYNLLGYALYNNTTYTQRFISHIKDGIQNLIDLGLIIKKFDTNSSWEYILDLSKLYFDVDGNQNNDNFFIIIDLDEVHKIMSSKLDKFNLLRCFIVTVGTFNNNVFSYLDGSPHSSRKTPIGFMKQEYIGELCGLHQNKYGKYANELVKLNLLYIKNNADYYLYENIPKKINNIYSRPIDKEWADKYAEYYANTKNSIKCNKKLKTSNGNKKRSIIMKYNALVKGKQYSTTDLKEMYDFLFDYNAELDKQIKIEKDKGYTGEVYLDKKKDLTIFAPLYK